MLSGLSDAEDPEINGLCTVGVDYFDMLLGLERSRDSLTGGYELDFWHFGLGRKWC